MPTFDVVIPCYNYARFLEPAVRSVLDQEGADVRVLIIDDCSTDDSALVGQRLADADPRVEFRRHETNKGHIATYNEGLIGWAKAEYSLLLSADDVAAPGAFQRAAKLFETSESIGFVFGQARIFSHDGLELASDDNSASATVIEGADFIKFCCESCYNPVPTPSAIVRTAWQQRFGGYRSDLPHSGDLEMWMRFAQRGAVGHIPCIQAGYRWHGSNMGNQYYTKILSDRLEFEQTCLDTLNPVLDTEPGARLWLASMYARLFTQAQTNASISFDSGDVEAFKAWSAYADRISGHLDDPRPSLRLAVRKVLGPGIWNAIRRARTAAGARLPDPRTLSIAWSPSHGQVIGVWPTQA